MQVTETLMSMMEQLEHHDSHISEGSAAFQNTTVREKKETGDHFPRIETDAHLPRQARDKRKRKTQQKVGVSLFSHLRGVV